MKKIFVLGEDLKINFSTQLITDGDGKVLCKMTKKPGKVLEILVGNCGTPVSYDAIINYVWGLSENKNPAQNVRDQIKFLRKYADGLLAPYITEVTGIGYIFNCDYPQPEEYAESPVDGLFPITQAESIPIASNYISRFEQTELMSNFLSRKGRHVHAIVGERGLGKTTLAGRFAADAIARGIFKYVISASYSTSIRETVERIGKTKNVSDPFSDRIAKLTRLCELGETLILIDNYDNPNPSAELSFDCDDYRRLAETGCSILFTSACDLGGCYLINDNVTYLSRIATPLLVSLYFSIKRTGKDDKKAVARLIENYLFSNTYLVVLCGELARQGMTADEIIESIETLSTDDTGTFSIQKDGRRQDEETLLEHYCRVLDKNKTVNPDGENERRAVHEVLSALALMPIGGIEREDFEALTCDKRTRRDLRRIIARLERHNLVFGDTKIVIQPIVREYLLREIFITGETVCRYFSALSRFVDIHSYVPSFSYWLSIAEAAYGVISDAYISEDARVRTDSDFDKSEEISAFGVLTAARITAAYSAVNIYSKAYDFGGRVLPSLSILPQARELYLDPLTLSTCFNAVGYAHLHAPSGNMENNLRTAYDCIKKAEELALSELEEKGNPARAVLSKLHGEFAAYYLKRGDYGAALEYHTMALGEREKLIESDPESHEYKRMLAFTYRGLGTDHYYLSKKEDKEQHLRLSYGYNLRSVEIFEELYGSGRLETVTGINRLVGTGIELMKCSDSDIEGGAEEFILYLDRAFDFYATCTFALCAEIADSLSKLVALSELIGRSDALEAVIEKAVEITLSFASADEKCLELCEKLENL